MRKQKYNLHNNSGTKLYNVFSNEIQTNLLRDYIQSERKERERKSCYNPLRLGTVIVLVSSGIVFVNTPRLYSDRATR